MDMHVGVGNLDVVVSIAEAGDCMSSFPLAHVLMGEARGEGSSEFCRPYAIALIAEAKES